jgi:hypothetical protein
VEEDLPRLVNESEELIGKAEHAKNSAQSEFEALNMLEKGKALGYVGFNFKEITKLPG